jgi:ubiquinone/menaquinone biosynthesis C-methylase UbiE
MPDSTQRFSDRVENYIRYRPGYPVELIDTLKAKAGLNTDTIIADVGSGTGISTAVLLPYAAQVIAIEPNEAMRLAAESLWGDQPNFRSVNATAEATTLTDVSIDLITVGQAFHWFKPAATRREFARILKPGGYAALIWNERLTDTTPFLRAYDNLLKTKSTDYDQVNHARVDTKVIAEFFTPKDFGVFEFSNAQHFDLAGLIGRALSSSYVPNAGQPGHHEFMHGLRDIYAQHAENDRVTFEYTTRLYLGQLT